MTKRRRNSAILFGLVASTAAGSTAAQPARPCGFDRASLSFAGTPRAQARCLLRGVAPGGEPGETVGTLPPTLERIVGETARVSSPRLAAYLAEGNLPIGQLDRPIAATSAGLRARYFVIHDTSTPYFGDRPFPADIDHDQAINNLRGYERNGRDPDKYPVAHAFINRLGQVFIGHDFSLPWRATQLEMQTGPRTRGLFIHVENVQPRRRPPHGGPRNDRIAPDPGLSESQYQSLAALYVVASMRAGRWLIPGFHANIDRGVGSHDDPQFFQLDRFDQALATVLERVELR